MHTFESDQSEPSFTPCVSCRPPTAGPDVTRRFLEDNQLQVLVRSHEVKEEGYEVAHDGYCITVFSAPNYCDQMGNKARGRGWRRGRWMGLV